MPQNESDRDRQDKQDGKPNETLSFFITKVLDQLSVSSWLPAIMLTCNSALVIQLRSQHDFDLGRAIRELTAKPLGILITLVLSIVVATIVTQAFEFRLIRILEGYWGSNWIIDRLSSWRIRHYSRRQKRLKEECKEYSRQAFRAAKKEMQNSSIPRWVVDILDRQWKGKNVDRYSADRVAKATEFGWRQFAPPEMIRRIDSLEARKREYPTAHRVLPTRLGNMLRSGEEQLTLQADEHLEEFVYRRYGLMDEALRLDHDRFRSQLNIYCMLSAIFAALAALSPVALTHHWKDIPYGGLTAGAYVILAVVSYRAALASAAAYVRVLLVLNSRSRAQEQPTPASS